MFANWEPLTVTLETQIQLAKSRLQMATDEAERRELQSKFEALQLKKKRLERRKAKQK